MKTRKTREPDVPPPYDSAIRALHKLHATLKRSRYDHSALIKLAESLIGTPYPAFDFACQAASRKVDLETEVFHLTLLDSEKRSPSHGGQAAPAE